MITVRIPPQRTRIFANSLLDLRQFAAGLNLSLSRLQKILETDARDTVIFWAGRTPDRLLILDGKGLTVLLSAAQRTPGAPTLR